MSDAPCRLYCHCAYAKVVPEDTKGEVLRRLQDSGEAFESVPDLCEMSARKDPELERFAAEADLRIAACYPRAVRWLFHAAGAPLGEDAAHISNMREAAPEDVLGDLLRARTDEGPAAAPAPATNGNGRARDHVQAMEQAAATPAEWTPWFPVIDYQRCTNCMQCLSFCLFDVYGVDEAGQIEVRNESNCKTNCPACSRVCPDVAILFPKYKKGPINGDVVRAEDVQSEAMKVDISALLGGDIYSSLKSRSTDAKKRFSTERDESKALLERKRCLKELKEGLDIPDEVLMTLPSAGEIEERARRAKEKLEKRMARSQTVKDRRVQPTEDDWGI